MVLVKDADKDNKTEDQEQQEDEEVPTEKASEQAPEDERDEKDDQKDIDTDEFSGGKGKGRATPPPSPREVEQNLPRSEKPVAEENVPETDKEKEKEKPEAEIKDEDINADAEKPSDQKGNKKGKSKGKGKGNKNTFKDSWKFSSQNTWWNESMWKPPPPPTPNAVKEDQSWNSKNMWKPPGSWAQTDVDKKKNWSEPQQGNSWNEKTDQRQGQKGQKGSKPWQDRRAGIGKGAAQNAWTEKPSWQDSQNIKDKDPQHSTEGQSEIENQQGNKESWASDRWSKDKSTQQSWKKGAWQENKEWVNRDNQNKSSEPDPEKDAGPSSGSKSLPETENQMPAFTKEQMEEAIKAALAQALLEAQKTAANKQQEAAAERPAIVMPPQPSAPHPSTTSLLKSQIAKHDKDKAYTDKMFQEVMPDGVTIEQFLKSHGVHRSIWDMEENQWMDHNDDQPIRRAHEFWCTLCCKNFWGASIKSGSLHGTIFEHIESEKHGTKVQDTVKKAPRKPVEVAPPNMLDGLRSSFVSERDAPREKQRTAKRSPSSSQSKTRKRAKHSKNKTRKAPSSDDSSWSRPKKKAPKVAMAKKDETAQNGPINEAPPSTPPGQPVLPFQPPPLAPAYAAPPPPPPVPSLQNRPLGDLSFNELLQIRSPMENTAAFQLQSLQQQMQAQNAIIQNANLAALAQQLSQQQLPQQMQQHLNSMNSIPSFPNLQTQNPWNFASSQNNQMMTQQRMQMSHQDQIAGISGMMQSNCQPSMSSMLNPGNMQTLGNMPNIGSMGSMQNPGNVPSMSNMTQSSNTMQRNIHIEVPQDVLRNLLSGRQSNVDLPGFRMS